VLIHDPTLRRLTGDRRRVKDLTRRELASFRLASGERFLFFDRFAEMFKNYYWTLDIKPQNGDQTIAALDAWAQKNNFKAQLVKQAKILTWRAGHENQLKRRFPGAIFYARRSECWWAGLSVITGIPFSGGIKPGRIYALPPYIGKICLFRQSVVRSFHQRNARTIAFLPQTDFLTQQAVRAGFDEIITNGAVV
jgi:glycerophosphoryl diester phosphodiesterase